MKKKTSEIGFELGLFGFAPLIFGPKLALIGFELALYWVCFLVKSSFSVEKWGKLGLFCKKSLICRTFSTDVESIPRHGSKQAPIEGRLHKPVIWINSTFVINSEIIILYGSPITAFGARLASLRGKKVVAL